MSNILTEITYKPQIKVPKALKDFTAGWIASGISVYCGHPLDTVRTRMQLTNSSSFKNTLVKSFSTEGISGLYRGWVFPVVGRAPISGLVFTANNLCMKYLKDYNLTFTQKSLIAGIFSGAVVSPISTPIDHFKIRQQGSLDGNISSLAIYEKDKISGIYRGLRATVSRDVIYYSTYFSLYAKLRNYFGLGKPEELSKPRKVIYTLLSGWLAGQLSWIAATPIDVVKNYIQSDPKHTSVGCTLRYLKSNFGYKVFFKGTVPSLIRAGPVSAIFLFTYEGVTKMLEKV